MAAKIVWLAEAVSDLEDIARYIESQSSSYASVVIARILETVEPLSDFPLMCGVIREDKSERHRQLVCYSYRIIYRAQGDYVYIIGVIHGARQLPSDVLRRL
jgi:plasmid stabilization system protein ParE